jgi:hypothetical protein
MWQNRGTNPAVSAESGSVFYVVVVIMVHCFTPRLRGMHISTFTQYDCGLRLSIDGLGLPTNR